MAEKTLIILKPDALSRGITGDIIKRIERTGLKLVACKMMQLDKALLQEHYSHIADKPFFPEIEEFMQSAPVIVQVWEGLNAASVVRKIVGVTNSSEAAPGTIRGDFALHIMKNTIHASEDKEIAKTEIERFFSTDELYSYERCDAKMIGEAR